MTFYCLLVDKFGNCTLEGIGIYKETNSFFLLAEVVEFNNFMNGLFTISVQPSPYFLRACDEAQDSYYESYIHTPWRLGH